MLIKIFLFKNNLSAYNRCQYLYCWYQLRVNTQWIFIQYNHIRKLPFHDFTFTVFFETGVSPARGRSLDGFFYTNFLIGP